MLSSKDYMPLIVAYRNGALIKLVDVANVVADAENVKEAAWMDTTPAVIVNVQRRPGANIIAVVDRIKALMPRLKTSLPASLNVSIPSIAAPLSIVGTFGVMHMLGYSLNNLTLMALTISTGFVVDVAIVINENISRYREQGLSPYDAAVKGAVGIGFTVMSISISLIAVFIPILFMGDIVGRLFREFATTLAVTILMSAVVSLTLTPMMSANCYDIRPESERGWFYRKSEKAFEDTIAFLRPHA
jgi:multidrug efflux pump